MQLLIRSQKSALIKSQVHRRSTSKRPSSAAAAVTNKNVLMHSILYDREDPYIDTDSAVPESVLRKYLHVFQCLFKEIQYHFEQWGCDVELRTDLVLTALQYNVHPELGDQASNYEFFREDYIAEMVEMCGVYPTLSGHTHISCSSVQLSSSVMAVFASTESFNVQYSVVKKRIRNEIVLNKITKEWFTSDTGVISIGSCAKKSFLYEHIRTNSAIL